MRVRLYGEYMCVYAVQAHVHPTYISVHMPFDCVMVEGYRTDSKIGGEQYNFIREKRIHTHQYIHVGIDLSIGQ